MPKITIDGQEIEVADGQTVLQACLANNIPVPYFCYHPKLSIAGNCRMCLVEIEGRPKLEISCNTRCAEGMAVKTTTPAVLDARKSVLEFILVNHPLDCPICDQAGECDLQDQYFDFSATPYRFQEAKVHKPKAVALGDLVMLDDERCIVCTRCVRFCDEVAGTHELCVAERGDRSTITTFSGAGMENAYSLNTVDICPVGALTNRDFRFNKRAWFLKHTPSVCTGCATGCNVWLDHDGGVAYRYRPRENTAVNQEWMCDEGRLTYKFVNAPDRVTSPHVRVNGAWQRVGWEKAMAQVHAAFLQVPAGQRGVVLSAQCSTEENLAWWWLATHVWKTPQLFATRREYANATDDAILRHRDKNPNSACLAQLQVAVQLAQAAAMPRVLVVLDTLSAADIAAIQQQRPQLVVLLTTNWGVHADAQRWRPLTEAKAIVEQGGGADLLDDLRASSAPEAALLPWADVILPLATMAEQCGTFINAARREQCFAAAFPPKGEAKPAWQMAGLVARAEGHEWSLARAEEIRRSLGEVAGMPGGAV